MFSKLYSPNFVAASILFIATGVVAIWLNIPWLMVLPFAVLLLPAFFSLAIRRTEIVFYALLALIPLSAEVNVTPTLGLDFPDELLMMLLTGLFVLKVVHRPQFFPKSILESRLAVWLLPYFFWLVVSCVYSQNPLLSAKFAVAKIWFVVPFVILPSLLLKTKKQITTGVILLLAAMFLVALQSMGRHALLGFTFEGIKDTLSPFFRNHVTYSAMLVCLLPTAVAAYHLSARRFYRQVALFVLIVFCVAILLSFSRGAWLAILAGLVAFVAIRKRIIGILLTLAVVAVVCMSTWLVADKNYLKFAPDYNTTIFHSDLSQHLQATVTLRDVSNAERFYRWVAAANMVYEKPLTGFGPNTFYPYYQQYTQTPFKTWVSDNNDHSTVHNYYLLILVEQGIPGLLIYCGLLFSMLLAGQKLYHSLRDRFYKYTALAVGVTLVMIASLVFMNDLIETDKTGSLFWLCLGMLVVLQQKQNRLVVEAEGDAL